MKVSKIHVEYKAESVEIVKRRVWWKPWTWWRKPLYVFKNCYMSGLSFPDDECARDAYENIVVRFSELRNEDEG